MKETNHHDPPMLRFTKEELEDPELASPIAKAEKAADKYEAALKKLKKKRRLNLSREEVNTSEPEITDKGITSDERLTIKSQVVEGRNPEEIFQTTATFDKQHSNAGIGRARAMEGTVNKATAALAKKGV